MGTDPQWPAGCACCRANHLTALNAAARTVELDSSQNRERCQLRKATLPLSTRPLELLSGLETEQGCCQLRKGPLACRFSIHRAGPSRTITSYIKRKLLKVSHDLAFLSSHGHLLPLIDGHDEAAASIRPDFHNCAPYLARQRCRGNDTYGITGIPSTVGGRGVVRRAGLAVSTGIVYPGSGREDA